MNHAPTIWLTGMSGAGKTTIARMLGERLRAEGVLTEILDGDLIRTHLSKGLGFSKEDRNENVRRIGFLCELLNRNGVTAIVAAISPYRESREYVRNQLREFIEVYVTCPLPTLIERDVKGLYRKALAGEIASFTGISDPYEEPPCPEVAVRTDRENPEESVARIWDVMRAAHMLHHGGVARQATSTPVAAANGR